MLDVDQAPEAPGIYAWYAVFRASPQDWKLKAGPHGDEAIDGFLNLIRRYASYHEPSPIDLVGKGTYGARWHGDLVLDYPLRAPSEADGDDSSSADRLGKLVDAIESEDRRQTLAKMLEMVTPAFSSPLYIGVAENLRNRLCQHRQNFTNASEWLQDHPDDAEIIQVKGKSFGARAAARDIPMEYLEAWVIDLNHQRSDLSSKQLRSIAESAEWLLHRLYGPILGRQ
jgi:hypothetical protein